MLIGPMFKYRNVMFIMYMLDQALTQELSTQGYPNVFTFAEVVIDPQC